MSIEQMRTHLLGALDPSEYVARIGFEPDDWQEGLLRSSAQRIVVCCARQTGKSTTVGLLANHVGATISGSLTLVVAPAFRQSLNLFRKIKDVAKADPAYPERVKENETEMELINGSRIVALPGKDETIRSYSGVTLLIIDEAAYVADRIFTAVRPMVATSKGRIALLSTPRAKSGFFFEAWERGEPAWERYRVTAYECPRIPSAEIEEVQLTMPKFAFDREYRAEFTDPDESLFTYETVQAAFGHGHEKLYNRETVKRSPMKALKVIHG